MERNRLQNEAKDDERARLGQLEKVNSYARWENDTDARLVNARQEATMFDFQAGQDAELNSRRNELANLYDRELKSWKMLLSQQKETPQDVKARIKSKAMALKKKRESEQAEYVHHQRMRQWRDGCDDLRQLDSQATLNDVASRRAEQLEEKARQQHQELEDEDQWSNAWEVDRLRKEARERKDLANQHKRDKDQLRDLNLQVQQNAATKRLQADQTYDESQAQKQQWDVEDQKQKEYERACGAANYKRGQDVLAYNNQRQELRLQASKQEMENELTLLQVALEKEARELEAEEEKKRQEKAASAIYQKHLQAQMVKEKADDSLLEELRRQDEAKAADKRDSQKRREDSARAELATQVQLGREQQKQEKMKKVMDDKDAEAQYAREQSVMNTKLDNLELEKRAMQAETKRMNQHKVRLQISAKEQMRQQRLQDEYIANRTNQYTERQFNAHLMQLAGQARAGGGY